MVLTNTGGGLDTILPDRGGYFAARTIARYVLNNNGNWRLAAPKSE